jgi:glycosyltransferase involved in cell wall biosynthesis
MRLWPANCAVFPNSMKPIAFVVQRYGLEVNGGAEHLCRQIVERLRMSVNVEVLTTCAIDHVTWRNDYVEGTSYVNGIRVLRFPVDYERRQREFRLLSLFTAHLPIPLTRIILPQRPLQKRWMLAQGPYSTPLLGFLADHIEDYYAFVFFTYLYCTTYFGLPLVAHKSVLVPTAHDEPYLYLDIYRDLFRLPACIIYNTEEEESLVTRVFQNQDISSAVLGVGIEGPEHIDTREVSHRYHLEDGYLLYLGRIERAKGCRELFDFYHQYTLRNRKAIPLVLLGRVTMSIPDYPGILQLGFVSEEDKWALLAGAKVNVIPSKYESLSLTLLEGWAVGRPALVNGRCAVLRGHIQRCGGGLWYEDYPTFEQGLNRLLDTTEAATLGQKGKAYVQENFRWDRVIQGYQSMIAKIEVKN